MRFKTLADASVVMLLALMMVGCNAQGAVIAESPLAPTVALLDEQDGAQVGVTAEGETQYAFDKYGPLGKEVWDQIAFQWTSHGLNTEDELRLIMDATYGNMSTKEELTQDILALERDALDEGLTAESQTLETNPNIDTIKQSSPNGNTQDTPAQQSTQPQQETKQEQTQAQETQAPPQQKTPAPQAQEQAPQQNNGLIPGTNLPSTGDPQVDAALAESHRQKQERVSGGGEELVGADQGSASDQGAGLNWN